MVAVTSLCFRGKRIVRKELDNPKQASERARYMFDTYFIGQLSKVPEYEAAQILLNKVQNYLNGIKRRRFLTAFIKEMGDLVKQVKSAHGYCAKIIISFFGDYELKRHRLHDFSSLRGVEDFLVALINQRQIKNSPALASIENAFRRK